MNLECWESCVTFVTDCKPSGCRDAEPDRVDETGAGTVLGGTPYTDPGAPPGSQGLGPPGKARPGSEQPASVTPTRPTAASAIAHLTRLLAPSEGRGVEGDAFLGVAKTCIAERRIPLQLPLSRGRARGRESLLPFPRKASKGEAEARERVVFIR